RSSRKSQLVYETCSFIELRNDISLFSAPIIKVYSRFSRSAEGVSKKVTFFVSPGPIENESWLNEKEKFPKLPEFVNVDEAIIFRSTCWLADTTRGISIVSPRLILNSLELLSTANDSGFELFNMPSLFSVHSETHNWLFFPIENRRVLDMPQE